MLELLDVPARVERGQPGHGLRAALDATSAAGAPREEALAVRVTPQDQRPARAKAQELHGVVAGDALEDDGVRAPSAATGRPGHDPARRATEPGVDLVADRPGSLRAAASLPRVPHLARAPGDPPSRDLVARLASPRWLTSPSLTARRVERDVAVTHRIGSPATSDPGARSLPETAPPVPVRPVAFAAAAA